MSLALRTSAANMPYSRSLSPFSSRIQAQLTWERTSEYLLGINKHYYYVYCNNTSITITGSKVTMSLQREYISA